MLNGSSRSAGCAAVSVIVFGVVACSDPVLSDANFAVRICRLCHLNLTASFRWNITARVELHVWRDCSR